MEIFRFFCYNYFMEINRYFWGDLEEAEKEKILARSELNIEDVKNSVAEILACVKRDGDKALIEFAKKFDKVNLSDSSLLVSQEEFLEAESLISAEIKAAIEFSIKNVFDFHKKQTIDEIKPFEIRPGVWAGEKASPIESLGVYVPRGRGSFPSMLYMTVIPAVIAKVPFISVATPSDENGKVDPACLYAAKLCGVSEVYKVGGAQAIAALAYGTESIKKVVKITGPGSKYVTAAKRLLYGFVDVGLPAGPSESIIIADSSADAKKVALDLITEAEHGSDSSAILLTDSIKLADSVEKFVKEFVSKLPENRAKFISDVLCGYGGFIITKDIDEAVDIANELATEHLQIATKDPMLLSQKIKNAGEIIIGNTLPFSAANYSIGPNAVLPTGGNAKTFSAVSVRDFVKYSSIMFATEDGYDILSKVVPTLAEYEGFAAHANAFKLR